MTTHHIRSAIYARVSSEQRADEEAIVNQIQTIEDRVSDDGLGCDRELVFADAGYGGSSLMRPALERLRRRVAAGAIDRLYVLSPDRLARQYADQALLVEELTRCGVEVVFLDNPIGWNPDETWLREAEQP